jgi:hypothetical protein
VRASPVQQTGRPGSRRLVVQAVSAPDTVTDGIYLILLLQPIDYATYHEHNSRGI